MGGSNVEKKGFADPRLTQNMAENRRITANGLINYETSISNFHNFKLLFGIERITGDFMNFSAYRKNYVSTALDELFAGGLNQVIEHESPPMRRTGTDDGIVLFEADFEE